MLIYAILGYIIGGPIFFVLLEILVVIATVLMMLNSDDKIDTVIIGVSALCLIIWSLYVFEGYQTILFILGLSGIGFGYAFTAKTLRRQASLFAGSALIATFSYLQANWIFFFLNLFFALFSFLYLIPFLRKK